VKRRTIADVAAQAGLGKVERTHREQCVATEVLVIPLVVVAIIVGVALLNEVPYWLPLTMTCVLVLWLAAALIRWWPVSRSRGRRWFVVAERGLIVWTRTAAALVIAWDDVTAVELSKAGTTGSTHTLRWSAKGEPGSLEIRATSKQASLIKALQGRKAVSRRVGWLQPAATTAAALVTMVLLLAQFGPTAVNVALGERPASLADLKRICFGGKGFGRAAAYTGSGPHPVLLTDEAKTVYSGQNGRSVKSSVPPHEVELVACFNGVVRAPGNVFLGDCDYVVTGSDRRYVYHVYQGRMRLTVHEARTARTVASLTVDGRKRPQCESIRFIHPNEPQIEERDTVPEESAYAEPLSPLINGKTRR
jgi:hypothetical protein